MNAPFLIGSNDAAAAAIAARLGLEAPWAQRVPAQLAPGARVVYRPTVDGLATARATLVELVACAPARLVLISSAQASPPSHHHPGFVAEGPPPQRPPLSTQRWLDLEAAAAELLGKVLLVLRPCALAASDSPEFLSRLLSRSWAKVPWGFDPSVQLLAPEDLAAAVAASLDSNKTGIFFVAPRNSVPLRLALRLAGVRRWPWPVMTRQTEGKREDLPLLSFCGTVSGGKISAELGVVPQQSSVEAIIAAFDRHGRSNRRPIPEPDPYGMDAAYTQRFSRTLFRFLHDFYWRVEVEGLEHVPAQGRAVVVGVHRGFMPYDGVMVLQAILKRHQRIPRFLIHPSLVKFPFLAPYLTKLGGILACQENAHWVLDQDELLGFFPEGIQGAFTLYRDAYRLGKFGRDEYVRIALRKQAPIVPVVTVGSAEIFPILKRIDWPAFERLTEWPYFPITPTFPLLPVPLPSKWHTRFLEPIHLEREYGPEAADDAKLVRKLSAQIRGVMQNELLAMKARRPGIFWGRLRGEKVDTEFGPRGADV
jgi:1-acyl-sn-glycerol-3-phosphate acyltransferase